MINQASLSATVLAEFAKEVKEIEIVFVLPQHHSLPEKGTGRVDYAIKV